VANIEKERQKWYYSTTLEGKLHDSKESLQGEATC